MNTNIMRRPIRFRILDSGFGILLIATLALASACNDNTTSVKPNTAPNTNPAGTASPAGSPAVSPLASPTANATGKAETLVGRWPGVEGTYLDISKKGEKFSIEIKDLDKAETFEGTAKGDVIEFTRKGKTETIRAASGDETGMKGFEKETNCVVVTKGKEGFCKK
jgi:hypothetical protein